MHAWCYLYVVEKLESHKFILDVNPAVGEIVLTGPTELTLEKISNQLITRCFSKNKYHFAIYLPKGPYSVSLHSVKGQRITPMTGLVT